MARYARPEQLWVSRHTNIALIPCKYEVFPFLENICSSLFVNLGHIYIDFSRNLCYLNNVNIIHIIKITGDAEYELSIISIYFVRQI